jgi:hypothetical protein
METKPFKFVTGESIPSCLQGQWPRIKLNC